ncbi:MAG: GTP-binding protein HflX [Hydrogenibacillus schlegelii]|uniref:GTPase HflX n=1 Tax=Hydrogenibacillus schlegelii TaxID=1484 RepID=A0A2T5GD95_HYDSH|nr:GTPase HflX [Hydrogenibacillus schlegelii]PTQ54164.1 MAG: GTP-binding protein HflX [Hydrogenibacillus schlegelii]
MDRQESVDRQDAKDRRASMDGQEPEAHQERRSGEAGRRAHLVALAIGRPRGRGSAGGRGAEEGTPEESLEELARLVETAGLVVVGREVVRRARPDPATYLGAGKVEALAARAREGAFDVVVFDDPLTPVQQRNLERLLDVLVLDRTGVILDLFAQRARSREAKLQVELAQLEHLLPRVTGRGVELSRLAGGIGTRGPGETKLEVDRRRIRDRMAALRRALADVRAHRARLRGRRERSAVPVVALTGYTNAGKSTLHRALAGSDVLAEDRPFATLDAIARRVEPKAGEPYLLVDTVGFVRKLPPSLVAAFRSTLEEVAEADLILHVVDASHPRKEMQMAVVRRVLEEIGAAARPILTVYNKIDRRYPDGMPEVLPADLWDGVAVSAARGWNLDALEAAIQAALSGRREVVEALVPYDRAQWVAWAHREGWVLAEEARPDGIFLRVELEKGLAARLRSAVSPP